MQMLQQNNTANTVIENTVNYQRKQNKMHICHICRKFEFLIPKVANFVRFSPV